MDILVLVIVAAIVVGIGLFAAKSKVPGHSLPVDDKPEPFKPFDPRDRR